MRLKNAWDEKSTLQRAMTCPHCGVYQMPWLLKRAAMSYEIGGGSKGVKAMEVHACTSCTMPYIWIEALNQTIPSARPGADLKRLPPDIESLYAEARDASAAGAFTACAMVARKVLMNLAVLEGADQDKSFHFYVDYLVDNGFVPPRGRAWVDRIRKSGNEATHEIRLATRDDAANVMKLLENLLRFNFEMVDVTNEEASRVPPA